MPEQYHNDPLHGMTLEKVLKALVEKYGWKKLSRIIEIRCFYNDPSIKSSLKFLRKTEWARKKVEELYCKMISQGTVTPQSHKSDNSHKPTESEIPWYERRRIKKREE